MLVLLRVAASTTHPTCFPCRISTPQSPELLQPLDRFSLSTACGFIEEEARRAAPQQAVLHCGATRTGDMPGHCRGLSKASARQPPSGTGARENGITSFNSLSDSSPHANATEELLDSSGSAAIGQTPSEQSKPSNAQVACDGSSDVMQTAQQEDSTQINWKFEKLARRLGVSLSPSGSGNALRHPLDLHATLDLLQLPLKEAHLPLVYLPSLLPEVPEEALIPLPAGSAGGVSGGCTDACVASEPRSSQLETPPASSVAVGQQQPAEDSARKALIYAAKRFQRQRRLLLQQIRNRLIAALRQISDLQEAKDAAEMFLEVIVSPRWRFFWVLGRSCCCVGLALAGQQPTPMAHCGFIECQLVCTTCVVSGPEKRGSGDANAAAEGTGSQEPRRLSAAGRATGSSCDL